MLAARHLLQPRLVLPDHPRRHFEPKIEVPARRAAAGVSHREPVPSGFSNAPVPARGAAIEKAAVDEVLALESRRYTPPRFSVGKWLAIAREQLAGQLPSDLVQNVLRPRFPANAFKSLENWPAEFSLRALLGPGL